MTPSAPKPAESDASLELREISDVRTLRALAHPVRIALIETLSIDGALTATEAGERIGESSTTCSFHLRQLAKYGFVEEAGGGKGRSRPWRMTRIGMRFSSVNDDPEFEVAASVLGQMLGQRQLDRYQSWLTTRGAWPADWRESAGNSEFVFWLTPDELRTLSDELTRSLLSKFRDRLTDPSARPAAAVPVEMLVLSYPMRVPTASNGAPSPQG
jgi:hypothetical protein